MNEDSIPQNVSSEYARNYIRVCTTSANVSAPDLSKAPAKFRDILNSLYQINTQDGVQAANEASNRMIRLEPAYASLINSPTREFIHISKLGELPKPSYLIDLEIPERGFVVLFGPSGAGKSFVALDYAIRIAKTRPVIYIGAEGQSGYPVRAEAYLKYHNLNKADLDIYFDFRGINISNHVEVSEFVQSAKNLNPAFIVVDTLARTMEGDENTSRDMNQFIKGCDTLRLELGATIMVVHHTVKKGGSERGSGALRGAADVMIGVQNRDGIIELFCDKSKDAREFDKKYSRMEVVALPGGDSSCVLVPAKANAGVNKNSLTKNQRDILEFLALEVFCEAGAKSSTISHAVEIPEKTMYGVLSKLKESGLIKQSKKGDPFFITEQGLKAFGVDSTVNS